jgi:hypothetical protein
MIEFWHIIVPTNSIMDTNFQTVIERARRGKYRQHPLSMLLEGIDWRRPERTWRPDSAL